MAIADEQFISFTTFRRTGEAVSTPTWIVPVSDGRIGFWTAMGTGKTKRLAHTPRVLLQASDRVGKVKDGTTPVEGTAEMVRSGALFDEVQGRVRAKYGFMTTLTKALSRLGPQGRKGLTYADTVVLVRLAE
ncbi:pyridoxamine 5'-phosphate oxidase family protein [Nocardioides sp.]|uniref:pyridoxamine 5'-phosphate oxidase family protein n=1 Tax=Nocardioides sp. TaxID=35761 RepID=UPI00286C1972|nr:pyridoxamine 5'-phosphate oxidase family protein [Nocardioides sp.]